MVNLIKKLNRSRNRISKNLMLLIVLEFIFIVNMILLLPDGI